ncbi:MAG TPA: G1 family glutamic endopeptidase [Chloroflexota bacterium]|nr:G1 family glutamic endopeptidase [Chloroflexota bacterium]
MKLTSLWTKGLAIAIIAAALFVGYHATAGTTRSTDAQSVAPTVASAPATATPGARARTLASSASPAATATAVPTANSPALVAATSPAATPPPAPTQNGSAVSDTAKKAIQDVIQKANDEQQQAFAKHDSTIMRQTATSSYYAKLVQTNRDLENGGVSAIALVKIEWGPISLSGAGQAQATTFETWRTSYVDGTSDQSRDRNVYTLVQSNGAWQIQDDAHPDDSLDQPPGVTAPGIPGESPAPPFPIVPAQPGESHNWSGYSTTNGPFTGVSGTWTVPHPTTTTTYASGATWLGIGGVRSHDLIQAGTEETETGSGDVRYDAWIELLPRPSRRVALAVSPGDSITASIAQQSGDQWQISLKDNTTGKSYQTTVQYSSSLSSAEWVEEAPSSGRSRELPLEDFGTVKFSAASAIQNGKSMTPSQAGARPISMIDFDGQTIASPSKLSSDGGSFSISRNEVSPLEGLPQGESRLPMLDPGV